MHVYVTHPPLILSDEICKELLNSISDAHYPFRFCCLALAQLLKVFLAQPYLNYIGTGREEEPLGSVLSFSLKRLLLLKHLSSAEAYCFFQEDVGGCGKSNSDQQCLSLSPGNNLRGIKSSF